MRNLRFKKDDFLFIRTTYPSLFIKFKNSYEENGIVNVPLQNETDYDYYFDIVGDYVASSLNEAGELNEDGLRLEAAWDYADWSKEYMGSGLFR
ncbi:hypothetical protein CBF60_06315 [Lactobacillus taiwanensis]|uniref:hypothetical protein n=1 Tax=Lactobacillus taiwanensis TaxID=508451 RepID=UPI000B997BDB|nr:hypothetical protein [Lactobacillus taiwanensis]OYS21663.1 hypothetical protein CBF76_01090 [Lactobacillus taiwanensis]OYS22985.1 hypothetical protein CBF66_07905 [Lactobacillus taiwanensis]OYS25373.1 hypothetical protein CBF73_04675 [Lactobacillus taiwanensis]OYS25712.1 hypothetical protein CBF55_01260 [Lactobacillus taiwanensis]OYS27954.1 hypothetical protein CBF60_06315 [Lactobacillus taiwanensis]